MFRVQVQSNIFAIQPQNFKPHWTEIQIETIFVVIGLENTSLLWKFDATSFVFQFLQIDFTPVF